MEPFVVNVTKETDRKRGFRFFDGCLVSVKDVASEELFLERIKLAYSVFDAVVEPVMDASLETLAGSLITAVKWCLAKYFNAQSRQRSNRPLIVRTYYRDSDIMFCTSSDFVKALMYTRDPGGALDEYEMYFGEASVGQQPQPQFDNNFRGLPGESEQVQNEPEYFARCREEWLRASSAARQYTTFVNDFNPDAPYDRAQDSYETRAEAILVMIADRTSVINFLSYMFYMSPTDLRRRYDVSAACLNRAKFYGPKFGIAARACCREQNTHKKSNDVVKRAVMSFFQSRAEAADEARTDEELRRRIDEDNGMYASEIRYRNSTLLKGLLLLMFDKCLSSILDNGIENVNKRRRYATDAKGLGGANIYTGIIDTIGTVNVQYKEGSYLSEKLSPSKVTRETTATTKGASTRLTFPISTMTAENGNGQIDSN